MNKFIRFAFLPMCGMFLLSSQAAAVDTGTYKIAGATYTYPNPSLPACKSVAITVNITQQCGKLLTGSIKIGTSTAVPVAGRVYNDNTTIFLSGVDSASGSSVTLMGSYKDNGVTTSPSTITVINSTFDFHTFIPPVPNYSGATFNDFILSK